MERKPAPSVTAPMPQAEAALSPTSAGHHRALGHAPSLGGGSSETACGVRAFKQVRHLVAAHVGCCEQHVGPCAVGNVEPIGA